MVSRPNVKRLARRNGLEGLIGALLYNDWALLRDGSYVDLGVAVRIDAVRAMAASDDPRAVDAIARALDDGAPAVRLAAVNALRDRRELRALRALLRAHLVSGANRDELTASAAFEALCADPAFTAAPTVRGMVQREGDGPLEETELGLLVALADKGDEAAQLTVAALIDSLPDESPVAEERVVQGLVALRLHSVPALIEALDHERRRGRAAIALGRCGDGCAVTPLIEALGAEDRDLRRAAAETLGELGDPHSADALLAAAHDENHKVRAAAVSALNRLGSVAVLAQVGGILRPALEALGTWVELGAGDPASGRRQFAIDVPVRQEPTGESTKSIETNSKTEHPDPRERTDVGGDDDDAPDLVFLQEVPAQNAATVPDAEQQACSQREPPMTPQGENDQMTISDDEFAVARLARALVNSYLASRANGDEEAVSAALEGLCSNPVVTAAPVVRAVVQRDGGELLEEAELDLLGSLAGAGDDAAQIMVAALIDSLPDESPVAEERAVQGMVALRSHSVPALIEALADERRRGRAAIALGRCGDGRAVTPLIELLAAGNPAARRVAAEILGELGDPRSAEALLVATQDERRKVRAAAVSALSRLGSVGLLVEIAETWRAAIEGAGGRIQISSPDPTAGRLQLTIDVPVHSEPTGEPIESTVATSNPDQLDLDERPDVGGNDGAPDPTPYEETPTRNTPRFLRPPWRHVHSPNSK